jgi:hypothetical protein
VFLHEESDLKLALTMSGGDIHHAVGVLYVLRVHQHEGSFPDCEIDSYKPEYHRQCGILGKRLEHKGIVASTLALQTALRITNGSISRVVAAGIVPLVLAVMHKHSDITGVCPLLI